MKDTSGSLLHKWLLEHYNYIKQFDIVQMQFDVVVQMVLFNGLLWSLDHTLWCSGATPGSCVGSLTVLPEGPGGTKK